MICVHLTIGKKMLRTVVALALLCSCICTVNASQERSSGIEVSSLLSSKDAGDKTDRGVDGAACGCKGYQCGCCAHLQLLKIGLNDTVCTNLTYLPDQYGASLTVSVDGKVYYNNTVSAKNPPAICFGVPHLKQYAKLCLKFYDLNIAERRFSGCAEVVAKLSGLVMDTFKLGCFKIPPTQSKLLYHQFGSMVKTPVSAAQDLMTQNLNGTGCGCSGDECGCCVDLKLEQMKLNDTVCTNITYLPDEYGVSVTLSINGEIYFNKTVSARNPPPLCVGLPYLKNLASLCIQLYDMDIVKYKLTGCANMTATLEGEVIMKVDLGCFEFPPQQNLIMESRPNDSGLEVSEAQVPMTHNLNRTGCGCTGNECGCCVDLKLEQINLLNDTVCTNITYLPDEYGLSVTISINGEIYFNKTVSARNPPPLCVGLPYLKKLASLCIQLYDMDIVKYKLTGCAKLTVTLAGEVIKKVDLGCFKFPSQQNLIMESRPHVAGLEAMTQRDEPLVPGYKKTGCGCLYYDCGCCVDIPTSSQETVCANLTFIPVTSDVDLLLTINKEVLVNKTIPVRNPPPVCFQLPGTSKLQGCVQLYKLDIMDAKLTGCVRVMAEIDGIIVEKLDLGCFKFPNNPTRSQSTTTSANQHAASNWLKLSFKEAKRMREVENLMSRSNLKL